MDDDDRAPLMQVDPECMQSCVFFFAKIGIQNPLVVYQFIRVPWPSFSSSYIGGGSWQLGTNSEFIHRTG